jgi:hypothetical protein
VAHHVDEAYADQVFTQLGSMTIELDADPLVYGPKRLNGKVADCRNLLNICESTFLDVSQRLHGASRALRIAETSFEMQRKHMLATDPLVRAERSVSDRDAAATMKLRAEAKEIDDLRMQVADLESILRVVKAKRADLKDTQGRLRDQMNLCREELSLNQRWGSKAPPGATVNIDKPAGPKVTDVGHMLATAEEEIDIAGLVEEEDTPEEAAEVAPVEPEAPEESEEAHEAALEPDDEDPFAGLDDAIGEAASADDPEGEDEAILPVEEDPAPSVDLLFEVADAEDTKAPKLPQGTGSDASVDALLAQVDVAKPGGRKALEDLDDDAINQLLGQF